MPAVKVIYRFIAAGVILAIALTAALVFHTHRFLDAPLAIPDEGLAFTIAPGAAFGQAPLDRTAGLNVVDEPIDYGLAVDVGEKRRQSVVVPAGTYTWNEDEQES